MNLDMEERRAEIERIAFNRINSNRVKINKPWFNEEMRVEITKRNRIKRWRDKARTPEEKEYLKFEYGKQQNKIRRLVRDATEQYEIEISDDIKIFVDKDTKLSENINKLREKEKKDIENILYNEEGKVLNSGEIKEKRMMVQHGVVQISKTQSKSEKKKQKKKKKEEPHESDDGGEELDLSKELFPLSHYVGDPEDLINQIFSTITGPKIAAMLPPILKGTDLDELKYDCIHELSGMSKKRILCVINGQEMEGSSGSEEDEEEENRIMPPVKGTSPHGSLKRPIPSKEAAAAALLKKIKQEPVSDDEVQERDPVTGKSVMELLELEMRARIIKTMLDKGGDKGVLTEEMVSKVISGGKTDSKVKSPSKESHNEKRRSMGDKENAQTIDDDDDVQIVDSPDEKRSDRRHRRRRRRHGSRSGKHDRNGSNRRRSRSERGEERGSRSERVEERGSRNKHKSTEMSREEEEADKKKKKITRKEFEERMKRAKMNRKYRKRGDGSGEEVNAEEKENGEKKKKENESGENNKNENETEDLKEEGEDDGGVKEAASEKEEGEWDSNEEEEGECSNTGSSSYYSDYSDEGRNQGTHRKKSGSRSRSRSKSYSPHRSPSHEQRSSRRAPRVPIKTVPVGTVKMPHDEKDKKAGKLVPENKISSTQTKKKEEEEENWGQKCDIEFVDSEEDFDGENNGSKVAKKLGISFSLKKKVVPSINQKDIDDLPMKKRNQFDDLPDDDLPMMKRNPLDDVPDKNYDKNNDDQILILSDCEVEDKETLDKEAKNISKCKEVSKETEEDNTESIAANSVIIIPDDNNPVIESKSENKENKTTEKTLESASLSETKGNKEIGALEETLEINSEPETKENNVNIASKETLLNISVSEHKEKNEIDKKTDEICIEELNLKKTIDKELVSHSKSDKEETASCATNITEDTNVQMVSDIITEECNKGSTVEVDINKKVDTENIEPIIVSDEESREIISEAVIKKNEDIKVKLTVGKSKTKKVAADKIINDSPPPRTTRRSTRASKKDEIEQKSNETEDDSNIKKAKKKQKERKLAIENEKRILDFENEFEEPRDTENSEDNKSKNIEPGEEVHVSQTSDNRDSKEIISEQNKIPSEENLQMKTSDMVQNTEKVEEVDKPKDCEESFKGSEGRNVCQEPQVPNSESLKNSLKDGQVATKSSVEDVYHQEGYSKIQLGVSALDLTISKNKEGIQSNQVTPNIAGELSAFYHPDTSASNSVQDYSLNTPRTQDMDDEEEIDVVGGVDDEEIDVVGVDDDKVASMEGDNAKIAGMEDDNATTTGMEQFAAAQGYSTGLELHSEIKMLKDQHVEGDVISNIVDKIVNEKSKLSAESPGDFYRGMDELGYSDDEKVQDEVDIEKLRNSHVEPIRIETGLIRKKVPAKQKKDEVQYPDKSWASQDKKKKDKTKDTLVYQSLGSLCSVLPRESAPKSELLEENSQTSEFAGKDSNSDDECSRDSSKSLSETSKIMPEDESESRSSTQSKGANKEMEIIGEIEPSTAGNDEIDDGRSSWSMRWLQSEKVQKVVSSSKMLSRVRKKIQQKDKATKVTAKQQNETEQEKPKPKEPASNAVIGSIEEYERLFGKKTNTEGQTEGSSQATAATVTPTIATELTEPSPATSVPDTNTSQTTAAQQSTHKVPIIDSDSEGDSEEEALWSKIMGK